MSDRRLRQIVESRPLGVGGSGGSTAWAEITGKPATFPPTLPIAANDVTGLSAALASKADASAVSAALNAKQDSLGFTPYNSTNPAGYTANSTDAALRDRSTHTGAQAISTVTGLQSALDGKQAAGSYQPLATVLTNTTASFTTALQTKLNGIATGATANSPDATLLARGNHTGTQVAATISDFSEAVQDVVGPMIVAAGGTYDDAAGTITLPSSGGGSDPWTYLKLTADYTNATATFANVTDGTVTLTWTPPANTDWMIDARILFQTTTVANLPRIGVAIGAGASRGYGGANIWQPGATATTTVQANGAWADGAGVTAVQIAAGGVLTANVPYVAEITVHGRSGASPTPISIQMACETAGANICFVKRGSIMRYRTL